MVTSLAPIRRAVLAFIALAVALGVFSAPGAALAQADADTPEGEVSFRDVDILPIQGFIDPPVAGQIVDLIASAQERGSEVIILQIDSEGAISADLDELVTAIRESSVPVVVFVGPRVAQARGGGGAAALLFAAHVAAIAEDATVGPAAPLDFAGGSSAQSVQEATDLIAALAHDRLEGLTVTDESGSSVVGEAAIAQYAVPAGDLFEAKAVHLVVAGLEPLLTELDGRTVETVVGSKTIRIRSEEISVRLHSLTLGRRILHAATTPTLIYILLVVGLAMLLFEWFQPGFGVAGFTAIIMVLLAIFGLTVLPVTWWALALIVLGLGLYAIDTAIAGLGPVTLAATLSFAAGSLYLYGTDGPLSLSGGIVALMTLTAAGFFVVVLTIILRAQAGPDDLAVGDLVGRPGIVRSVLNPEGHVYVDGALWRARWIGEAKRAKVGTPVRVTATEAATLLVEEFIAKPGEPVPTGEVPDEALQTSQD